MPKDDDRSLTPEEMLCFDVYGLNQAFSRVYKPLLDPLGMTYPQYLVMSVLWDGAPASVGRIGKRLGLASSTLTPVLKRLEGQELIRRRRASDDERRVDVYLTPKGEEMQDRAAHVGSCVIDATGLRPDELGTLRTQLATLRDSLNAAS